MVEAENNEKGSNRSNQKGFEEPELICHDLSNFNFDLYLQKPKKNESNSNDDDSVESVNLSVEIKKEKKALGGPMFSKEENEKLRREKMRGGDFKEKSSESSNGSSGPPSPCGNPTSFKDQQKINKKLEEQKRRKIERRKEKASNKVTRKDEKH